MEQYGRYQLLRRIGRGGMAEVFLAKSTLAQGLAKTLVIKKIHPAFAKSNQFIAMFKDEAETAVDLNHPGIVQVFDYGTAGGTFFLAMEYVEGLDMLRLMQECARRRVPFPFGLSAYVVQQVCKALDYAHRKTDEYGQPLGIVHRDVSPQNVLVSFDGAVKIVDFGIARARHVSEDDGVIKGKFAYMSPEQARGEPVDRRSDVFSAGIVLYELVCARPAFRGKGKEVLEQVKAGTVERPKTVNPDCPDELEDAIMRAMAYHPDDRYQTARDLQTALGRFLFRFADEEDGPIDSSRLAQFVARVVPADKRRPAAPPPTASARPSASGTPAPVSRGTIDRPEPDGSAPATPLPRAAVEVRERKHVFVLEGRICGLASLERRLGKESAEQTLDQFLGVARDIAYKHEAHIHQIDAHRFTFVVGLPVAGEDDSSRTMRLSLALIDALDAIGQDVEPELRLALGVQRGVAVLKRSGGTRFSYELSATTIEVARRLADAATGAVVLVGGGVYRVAGADWNFDELDSIEMPHDPDTQPGVSEHQRARVYKLRGPKEREQRMRERAVQTDKDLLGRDLELKAMRDAYRDAIVSRRKRHVVILGEAGVGKRSLVSAFLASIPTDEAVITRAAARAATSYTPFAIIADLGRDLLGLAEGADGKEVRRRIEMIAAGLYPEAERSREVRGLTQAIGMLLGARFDDDDELEEIDAAERRQRIRDVLLHVEHRLSAEKALVVVGEDVHWADEQSAELFIDLLKVPSTRPILGIVTGRPDQRVVDSAAKTGADIIRLEELPSDARLQLVTERFADDEDVTDLANQIVARTGGNPFFINEVLDSLIEKGIVVADSDADGALRWVKRDAPIQVPTRVEALVSTRIDLLAPGPKQTLMYAAVMGRVFTQNQLDALAGRSTKQHVEALIERGLIKPAQSQTGYAFRNEMTMTVAYQLLPQDDRSTLHRDAAARLASAVSYRPGQDDAVIARHLELAGDAEDAADGYMKAAAHAMNVGGGGDALRQLTRALKLLPEDAHERRFRARRMREEILRNTARRPQQLREIDRMRKMAEAIGDPKLIAQAQARLTQFYIDVGKAPAARRAVGPALDSAREAGDELAQAEAKRLEASIARLVGNHDEALQLCDDGLELCDTSNEGRLQRASIMNVRGTVLWHGSKLHDAIEAYAEALVIYRILKRRRDEARVLNNMGIVYAELGEIEDALSHYKSSLKIDQELGDRASVPLKLGNIGQTYTDLGDTRRGERYLTKALKLAEQNEDDRSATDVVISLGQVHLQDGDAGRALGLFERGLELASANRDRYQEIRALIYLSLAQLDAGRPAEGALELSENATRLAHKMPMPVGEIFGLAAQALALAKLDRAAEGAEKAARAVALQSEVRQPEGIDQILHIHAEVAEQAGLIEDARSSARRAHEEVQNKAHRLTDDELREVFLGSRLAKEIAAHYERLHGRTDGQS